MSSHPDWVLAYKRPGTELKQINGRYYLYSVSSEWDKERKRTRKISGKLLGSIREDGFQPAGERALKPSVSSGRRPDYSTVSVKEYGLSYLVEQHMEDLVTKLREFYPEVWQTLLGIVYCRLMNQAPLNQMPLLLAHSYLSVSLSKMAQNDKQIALCLRDVGRDRQTSLRFMRSFITEGQHLLFDLTHLNSQSQQMDLAAEGPLGKKGFGSNIGLLYLFSVEKQEPVYYRLVPGNIRDVAALSLSIQESGVKDATVITDKGFYSAANANILQKSGLRFIAPLKRDNKLIDAQKLAENTLKIADNYFLFEGRIIWYATPTLDSNQRTLFLFVDSALKTQEEKDYLSRLSNKKNKYTTQNFHKKRPFFGLIALITNIPNPKPQDIYLAYKNRNNIEIMFDILKNILEADKSHMQNEETFHGWMFANHLALIICYRLYQLLQKHEIIAKHSVQALILQLSMVKKVNIDNQWLSAEVTKKSSDLFRKLEIPVT